MKKIIKFNFKPEIALESVKNMCNQAQDDENATEVSRKIWQDIEVLAEVGFSNLSKEPINPTEI